jgi:hypothetical protein
VKAQGPDRSLVEAAACSKGQYYDWGKSNAHLQRLIDDLRGLAVTTG